jgi:ribosomal protein L21E
LLSTGQLNLFEHINPAPLAIAPEILPDEQISHNCTAVEDFAPGICVKIVNAGAPFQHLNGQKGIVMGFMADAISVQVEGIAVTLMFRPEALEKWTQMGEYTAASTEAESVVLFRVGDLVECHVAFIGHVGIVRKIGTHCDVTTAWVDYGKGKPLYPCSLEHLTQIDE